MDHFELEVPEHMLPEIGAIMKFYNYTYCITISTGSQIIRRKQTITAYGTVQEFLLGEIFYKKKNNLHHYPIFNVSDVVCNFDISLLDIVSTHPVLRHLLEHSVFNKFVMEVHNYGTFVRFSENKVQQSYCNPLNAGIPLTAKEDPVYEMVSLMRNFGYGLLPDLVPTYEDDFAKRVHVNWRLLGESITVVLNEMMLVDYLKDTDEFKRMLRTDYDQPYKLFRIFKKIDWKNRGQLYKLFRASYQYFCVGDNTGFMDLIDKDTNSDWESIWNEFERYRPVARRVETNFDGDYANWYRTIKSMISSLKIKTVADVVPSNFNRNADNAAIMAMLFEQVFNSVIVPLFFGSQRVILSNPRSRKIKSFVRYMIGNLFLLIKYKCPEYAKILNILQYLQPSAANLNEEISSVMKIYRECVSRLYEQKKISVNEYLNYQNIYIMPVNVLRNDGY